MTPEERELRDALWAMCAVIALLGGVVFGVLIALTSGWAQ